MKSSFSPHHKSDMAGIPQLPTVLSAEIVLHLLSPSRETLSVPIFFLALNIGISPPPPSIDERR
jgi:hypothetical protein